MEVNATAKLVYDLAESSGWEGLHLVVKFKQQGKIFKTKLNKTLASTFNYHNGHLCLEEDRYKSLDDYFDDVEFYMNDTYTVKMVAEDMIKTYFENKYEKDDKNARSKDIEKAVSKMNKIEIKVNVK